MWHLGQVGLRYEDDLGLSVVQNLWEVPHHQSLCCFLVVLEGDDPPVAHVEPVAVPLGHLLLKLLICEPKEMRKRERGGAGSQGMDADPSNRATTELRRHTSSEMR